MERGKDRATLLERFHVGGVVVGCPRLPAPKEDADPFVGQSANDGVEFLASSRVVFDVITSPLAFGKREPGELMEGLAIKLGASHAEEDGPAFAALLWCSG